MVSVTKTIHEKEEALKYLEDGKHMGWALSCFTFKELKASKSFPTIMRLELKMHVCHKPCCCYVPQPSRVL